MKKSLQIMFLAVIIASCSKDDDPTKKDILIRSGGWKITAQTVSPPLVILGVSITDLFAQQDACDADDILVFNANGTYVVSLNQKCDPSDPATLSGTYAYTEGATSLTIDGDTYTLVELSASKLIVKYIEDFDGDDYEVTITFTAQ